jgi:hypothetical protein
MLLPEFVSMAFIFSDRIQKESFFIFTAIHAALKAGQSMPVIFTVTIMM